MISSKQARGRILSFAVLGVFLVFVAVLWSFPKLLLAGTGTGTVTVTANSINNCQLTSVNPTLAFVNYDPTAAAANTATTTIQVTCTNGDAVTIGLNTGLHAANATAPSTRAMKDTSATPQYLSYDIFQDVGHTTIWTNSGAGQVTQTATGPTTPLTFTLYGQIPAGQNVTASTTFSDSVTANISF